MYMYIYIYIERERERDRERERESACSCRVVVVNVTTRETDTEASRTKSGSTIERVFPLFFFSPCDSFFNQRRSGRDSEGNFENPGDVVGDVLFPFNFFFWKGNIFFFCDGFEER